MIDLEPIVLTCKLAFVVTILLFFISLPLAYWIAYSQSKLKTIIEVLVSMPLVLPPTVIGFYMLIFFSPFSFLGHFFETYLDFRFVFSFTGLVIASLIYSLPFMVHPLQSGFSSLAPSLREASLLLGKSKLETLVKVLLPNMKSSILTALVLTFAHTVGEFGVVLMMGGSIAGKTKVVSIAIYEEVESMNYSVANNYAMLLFAITFGILILVYSVNRRLKKEYK